MDPWSGRVRKVAAQGESQLQRCTFLARGGGHTMGCGHAERLGNSFLADFIILSVFVTLFNLPSRS